MITVAVVSYRAIREQPELLAEYALECKNPVLGAPNPQWAMYEQMQAAGALTAFTVACEGRVVGFAVLLIWTLPHYGVYAATVESMFVTKTARNPFVGGRLIQKVERYARAAGCKAILYSAPAGGRLEAMLAKRLTRTNTVFCKPLGHHA